MRSKGLMSTIFVVVVGLCLLHFTHSLHHNEQLLVLSQAHESHVSRSDLLPIVKNLMSYPYPLVNTTNLSNFSSAFNISLYNDSTPADLSDIDALVQQVNLMRSLIKAEIVNRLRQDQNDALEQLNVTRTLLQGMRNQIASLRGLQPPLPSDNMEISRVQAQIDSLEKKKLMRARNEALRRKKLELKREKEVKKVQHQAQRALNKRLTMIREVEGKRTAQVESKLKAAQRSYQQNEKRIKAVQLKKKREEAQFKLKEQQRTAKEFEDKARQQDEYLKNEENKNKAELAEAQRQQQEQVLERSRKASEQEDREKKKAWEDQEHALKEEEIRAMKQADDGTT